MHTTNAYAYNSVTQENNNKNQTVNNKQYYSTIIVCVTAVISGVCVVSASQL